MKIGIIGAGFTGLSAAYHLSKMGHVVTVFEQDKKAGGLAVGFTSKPWSWSLEKHYHHLFTSDMSILDLAAEVNHPVRFYRPKTATYIDGKIYDFDSPASVLKFPLISLVDRFRVGISIAFMKFNPFWKIFEFTTAEKYLRLTQGNKAWKLLWEPLMKGKFGQFSSQISAAWFWARIYKRSMKLGYPDGGFQSLADSVVRKIKKLGTVILYGQVVQKLESVDRNKIILTSNNKKYEFDRVISTLPFHSTHKLNPALPEFSAQYLGAVTLVISLKKPFLNNNTYWLNINDRRMPYLSVVEHTNYINNTNYGHQHVVYVGNYLPVNHEYFKLKASELFNIYLPFLKEINPQLNRSDVIALWAWQAPFAQPVVTPDYFRRIPSMRTSLPGIYCANMQQVYPWDRGTNYAVELGKKAAQLCIKD